MNDDNALSRRYPFILLRSSLAGFFNKKGPVAASFEDPVARFSMRDAM